MRNFFLIGLILITTIFNSCDSASKSEYLSFVDHPDWASDAVIYEVNTRQFTEDGTFEAFSNHLPRLNELGVKILWFMPIHKIGVVDRKGTLGSYYSIMDYKSINPEFGTIEDFKKVVDKAHDLGMKVIIDWVANHTSRDGVWLVSNPEWYVMDSTTNSPVAPFDWTDVAKLDFNNESMRMAMLDAMKYWLEIANIDGFRCDVAGEVPVDFWNQAVKELKLIEPELFMLAEAEKPSLQENAFNMYYGWRFHHIMNGIAYGKYNIDSIRAYFNNDVKKFPTNTIAMNFTSNHDENSWNGTEFERLKDHTEQMAALTFVLPGMPLIYNGQEVGFNRRLEFFEKDVIDWNGNQYFTDLYQNLVRLRKGVPALSALNFNSFTEFKTSDPTSVYAFKRVNGESILVAAFNFSDKPVEVKFSEMNIDGVFTDFKTGNLVEISEMKTIEPFGYKILYK